MRLLGGWLAWFLWADIPIYETSDAVTLLGNAEAEEIIVTRLSPVQLFLRAAGPAR